MKKSIFLAVLGVAACAATSCGQGYVLMNSYVANSYAGVMATYLGARVPGSWTAELYYALGTVSDSPGYGLPNSSFTAIPSSLVNFDANNDGYFQLSTPVMVPGYTGGPITFEVVGGYSGSSFARSGSFTMDSIANSASIPPTNFGDNGQPMPNFFVTIVPEPSTLALAGLGGLVSLVMFRRRPRTAVQ